MKTVAIVNPTAGRRQARRVWPRLLESLGAPGSRVVTWWSEYPRHAEDLAARARRQGFQRVVAVGGDGTLYEVANGLWREPRGPLPGLGAVPLGTGCDYVRNFAPKAGLRDHLLAALGERTLSVSAGVFHCAAMAATPGPRIFLNHLGVGFDADVVAGMGKSRLPFRGKLPYFLAGLRQWLKLHPYRLWGEINGEPVDIPALILVAGLGRTFGGGLLITPQASPQASHFQAVLVGNVGRPGFLKLFAGAFAGKPMGQPRVHYSRPRKFCLTSDPPAPVEAEGELVGQTPVAAEVLPNAFRVAILGI